MPPRPRIAYQGFLSVCVCVTSHFYLGTYVLTPYSYVLTRCHVTDINHVLTPCHVTEINYVDRGVAARTPLQLGVVEYVAVSIYMPMATDFYAFYLIAIFKSYLASVNSLAASRRHDTIRPLDEVGMIHGAVLLCCHFVKYLGYTNIIKI